MGDYKRVNPEELQMNLFHTIGKDWMLVTAEKEGKINTMTASWGGCGVLWNKHMAFLFIRPQRYTKEFLDAAGTLSLTFYDEAYRQQLSYCGANSGRDGDKITHCGFEVAYEDGTPYFTQAHTVFLCKKLYRQQMDPACILDPQINEALYAKGDYHFMYMAEIEKVLQRKD